MIRRPRKDQLLLSKPQRKRETERVTRFFGYFLEGADLEDDLESLDVESADFTPPVEEEALLWEDDGNDNTSKSGKHEDPT